MEVSSYNTASQYFIHRDFRAVSTVLGPTGPEEASTKAWVLYLALCDRAFIEPDRKDWPINDPDRKILRQSILQSKIWAEMQERWENQDSFVPHSLIYSGIKLALKHKSDPRPVVDFVENYLAQSTLPPAVLEAFILDIIVGLQFDFFYARETVNAQFEDDSFSNKQHLLDAIETAEAKHAELQAEETKSQAELERSRLEQAIASKKNEDSQEEKSDNGNYEDAENSLDDSNSTSIISRPLKNPRRKQRGLTEFWRQWFHQFIRSQGFYNTLIFVFMVIGLVTNARARILLGRGANWLWISLKSGIKMGLSVTYL